MRRHPGGFKTAPARAVSGLARRYTTTTNHADGRAATLLAALAMFYYLGLLLGVDAAGARARLLQRLWGRVQNKASQ